MRERWGQKAAAAALGVLAFSLGALEGRGTDFDAAAAAQARVGIANAYTRGAVLDALRGARRRLGEPRCERLLGEFTDAQGRPLSEQLAAREQSSGPYLDQVFFRDGQATPQCVKSPSTLAYTSAGSRVVFVCGTRFAKHRDKDPKSAEIVLIHEALHTLGLGENPPTSSEITARVRASCR
jgi:hypothetical protein